MASSHFSSIGFPVHSEEEFAALVEQAHREGEAAAAEQAAATIAARDTVSGSSGVTFSGGSSGRYVVWSPGEGVELWVQMQGNTIIGCNPHYRGQGRVRFGVTALRGDAHHPLDGALYGWASPESDDKPDSGDYPVLIDLPDFRRVTALLQPPRVVTLQVTAFAHELTLFESEDAYDAHRSTEELKFASESFLPSGLFRPEPAPPLAHAIFTGRIQAAQQRTNPVTDEPFYALLVQTLGGIYDVVADPALMQGCPVVGGIAQGSFWLSGRVLDDLPPLPATNLWQQGAAHWNRLANFARARGVVLN